MGKMEVWKEEVEGEKTVYRVGEKRKGGGVEGRSKGRENRLLCGREWEKWKWVCVEDERCQVVGERERGEGEDV